MMAQSISVSLQGDCAWEHSWVPQPPTPALLGCAAPLGPQDQCLVPVTLTTTFYICPLTSMKVTSLTFALLLLALYSVLPFSFLLLQLFQLIHCRLADMGNPKTASAVTAATELSLTFSATSLSPSATSTPLSSAFPLIS